ncbi:MAG: ABC transporter substrate-binding protein, partial [Candidatus Bathyarchaeia archaeon]
MKLKAITGIMLTLFLMSVLSLGFHGVSSLAEDPIKIGLIGPMGYIQGQGIEEGATLAVEEINDAGGVLGRNLTIYSRDDGLEDPTIGRLAMEKLITVDEVDFVVGGFRTEVVLPMKEVAMDYQKIFIITGSDVLLDCKGYIYEPVNCPVLGCDATGCPAGG